MTLRPKLLLNVLVIDDSAVVREAMTAILSRSPDIRVAVAGDPLIAMEKMKRVRPDVIVLDLEMPRMHGLDFLRKLMAENPLPVVVCSGSTAKGTEAALRALSEGAVEVVAKPELGIRDFLHDSAVMLTNTVRAAAHAQLRRPAKRASGPMGPPVDRARLPAASQGSSSQGSSSQGSSSQGASTVSFRPPSRPPSRPPGRPSSRPPPGPSPAENRRPTPPPPPPPAASPAPVRAPLAALARAPLAPAPVVARPAVRPPPPVAPVRARTRVIAIGASTGGTEAIRELLLAMPEGSPPIVIVQHMPPVFTAAYAASLAAVCRIEVKEAVHGDRVLPGRALIAPGGKHMAMMASSLGPSVMLSDGPMVSGHRPSVDVLFQSVAKAAGRDAVGVILTGMGADGAEGMLEMKRMGASTIAQDEKSCVVFGMPREAIALGAVDEVFPLPQIAAAMLRRAGALPRSP